MRVAVRLQPGAARDGIDGLSTDAAGAVHVAARVRAVPEKGKANAALEKLLAKAWGVPARAVAVVGGPQSRNKVIEVAGDDGLLDRLKAWGDTL